MQRIGRPGDMALNGKELQAKVEILQRHFPPSIAHLFALPQERNGTLEWWTPLQGRAVPFDALPELERQQLLKLAQERMEAVQHLSSRLAQSGRTEESQALQTLCGQLQTQNLWSVGGEPLITSWGQKPVEATVKEAAKLPPLAPSLPEKSRRSRWWWLLGALLGLLLLALAWFLWWSQTPPPSPPIVVTQNQDEPFQCSKHGVPPDFVMVIDTSGSMALNIGVSEALENFWLSTHRSRMPEYMQQMALAAPTRMDVAKQALHQVIDDLHPSITTQVVTLGECRKTSLEGRYTGQQRKQMHAMVNGLQAHSETPIAESLRHASRLVDGRDKDAVVLLFVDGADGCEENVCEVSRALHERQPRMRINVVNIGREPLSNCVAENTGGRVYVANDGETIARHLADATNEVMNRTDCKPR